MGKRKWYMIPVLVIAVLALVLVACWITDGSDPNPQIRPGLDGSGTFPSFTTGGVERPTQTNGTEDDMTEPENSSDPSGEATEPTEPGVEGTQPTNPGTGNEDPSEGTQPSNPGNEDTQPTDPGEDSTDPSEGGDPSVPTQPTQPTDPGVEDPTQPVDPTQPTAPPNEHTHDYKAVVYPATCTTRGYTIYTCRECGHNYAGDWKPATGHNYQKISTKKPTCTEKGYSTYRCDACGDTYTGDEKPATGHSYSSKVVKPTCGEQGYTQYTCSACNHSYKGSYTAATGNHTMGEWEVYHGNLMRDCSSCSYYEMPSDADTSNLATAATEFEAAVAKAMFKYLNQFRLEEGSTELQWLPGMSQVAQYRSRQLVTNFAHDVDNIREAMAHYKYGRWIDPALYGDPDGIGYYEADDTEAIGLLDLNGFTGRYTIDELAYLMADGYRNSPGHWRYLSSAEYGFGAIGVTWKAGCLYDCSMVGRTNYG